MKHAPRAQTARLLRRASNGLRAASAPASATPASHAALKHREPACGCAHADPDHPFPACRLPGRRHRRPRQGAPAPPVHPSPLPRRPPQTRRRLRGGAGQAQEVGQRRWQSVGRRASHVARVCCRRYPARPAAVATARLHARLVACGHQSPLPLIPGKCRPGVTRSTPLPTGLTCVAHHFARHLHALVLLLKLAHDLGHRRQVHATVHRRHGLGGPRHGLAHGMGGLERLRVGRKSVGRRQGRLAEPAQRGRQGSAPDEELPREHIR